ncbi:MAG: hypothetical protein ACK4IT_06560 [Thioalkalivibrionaceae bacterium]
MTTTPLVMPLVMPPAVSELSLTSLLRRDERQTVKLDRNDSPENARKNPGIEPDVISDR